MKPYVNNEITQLRDIKEIQEIQETIKLNNSMHYKMSLRLNNGTVTSITIKKNILALWIIYSPVTGDLDLEKTSSEKIMTLINKFVYTSLKYWDKETGKGLSDFITEQMIHDFLESQYGLYSTITERIKV